ncbi:10102_t:CDS:2 [Gigaspora margarita]|uniref:10102_t:CDS:1 n=1 Tax=Gigaspora margarita TaxID=4874 RepID=A0ABM8VYS6_GIGMA|nr:10102_t:CDS:2 [Gigaspora margarita]
MDQCECNQTALTANEKKMILSVYRYLKFQWVTNSCEEVSLATEVSEVTVARVLSEFHKTGTVISSEHGYRHLRGLDTDYVKAIQDLILSANKNGITLSLRILVLDLSELGIKLTWSKAFCILPTLSEPLLTMSTTQPIDTSRPLPTHKTLTQNDKMMEPLKNSTNALPSEKTNDITMQQPNQTQIIQKVVEPVKETITDGTDNKADERHTLLKDKSINFEFELTATYIQKGKMTQPLLPDTQSNR